MGSAASPSSAGISSWSKALARTCYGLGAAALHSLLGSTPAAAAEHQFPTFPPRAKRVIFLFQARGPSHLDLCDYKPAMKGRFNEDIPPSVFGTQRITGMVAQQDRFPRRPYDVRFCSTRSKR